MKIGYFILVVINLIVLFDYGRFHDHNPLGNDSKFGFIPGDYIIGALFPIHKNSRSSDMLFHFNEYHYNEYHENEICFGFDENEMQVVEAAFFAIDLINRNENILPNVTLGINIEDDCNSVDVAILQSKKLVNKFVVSNETEDIFSFAQKDVKSPLIGIIGPEGRASSKEVESFLKFFSIVQIYYSEPLLDFVDDDIRHPYFFSVTPRKNHMTEAIFDILTANNWTHVSLVYSSDLIGDIDLKQFEKLASSKKICIADIVPGSIIDYCVDYVMWYIFSEEFRRKHATLIQREVSRYIEEHMPSYDKVDVIMCYCSPQLADSLFSVISYYSTKRFVVIGGDGWPPSHHHPLEHQEAAVGEILVSLEQTYIPEFDDYFSSLNYDTNKRNPWFDDFWQHHFNCEINLEESKNSTCSENMTLADDYKQNPKVPYVIESVFVLAHALHNMLKKGCEDVSNGKLPSENYFQKSCFRKYVDEVKFDFYGKSIYFDRVGNVQNVKLNFHNFQSFENGSYDYVRVGEYVNSISINGTLVFPGNKTNISSSCCALCSPNHIKVLKEDKCCWDCLPSCNSGGILKNSNHIESYSNGHKYDSNETRCIPVEILPTKWYDVRNVISLSLPSLSITLAMFTVYVFRKNEYTPVVKSSTAELCYIMFIGMIFANLTPFVILSEPNLVNCVIIRVLPPISFTLMYAALLVKMSRIARMWANSKKKFPDLNLGFLSLRAQVSFTVLLISIEVLICSHSLFKYPLEPEFVCPGTNNTNYGIKICPLEDGMIFETYCFIGVLILMCAYFAGKTWNLRENFNETRYIGVSLYATILADICFGLMYLCFGNKVKMLAISLTISLNTLTMLGFLFAPKLYVILRMPEKNTEANFIIGVNTQYFIEKFQTSTKRKSLNLENSPYQEKFEKSPLSLWIIIKQFTGTLSR